jgi:DNA-binding transcriptional ArsR family regulator
MLTNQTRHTTLRGTRTREENNLHRYYAALFDESCVPSARDYAPFGDLADIAAEMSEARAKDGIAGLKKYLIALGKIKDPRYKRLVTILSSATPPQADEALNEPEPIGILLSDVKPQKVSWLWHPRLAFGKMAMLDGDPGEGKSNVLADLIARVSNGSPMPDNTPGLAGGAGVVIINPEDGLSDTTVPRLQRAGARLENILSISTVSETNPATGSTYERPFTLPHDLPLLEKAILRMQARLVTIDPVMAILPAGKDTGKDNEVRALLAPVKMLIEKHKAACIMVRHLNKSGGDHALYRGMGSIAFIGLARTGLMVLREPGEDGCKALAHVKSNIGKLAPPLSFRVVSDEEEGDDRPYIRWEGHSAYSVAEMLSPSTQTPSEGRQEIMALLREKYPEGMSPSQIAEALELAQASVLMTLSRMVKAGQIDKPARGIYVAKPE